jgi:hypothetical protein
MIVENGLNKQVSSSEAFKKRVRGASRGVIGHPD